MSDPLTTRQVGFELDERPGTVARWCAEGWIEAWKEGDEWRIKRSEVERVKDERFEQRQRGETVTAPKPKRPAPQGY